MNIVSTTLCYPTLTQPDRGVFVARRTAALAARDGVSVRVVSPRLFCPLLRRRDVAPAAGHVPAERPRMFSVPVLGWGLDGLSYARTLERAIRTAGEPVDVIDAHFEYPDGVGAWLAGRRLGVSVVVTVRGKIVSLSRKALRRMQIAAMLRGVAARIAVSRSLADWVRRIGGQDLAVEVIPNGVDADVFHPIARDTARRILGWNQLARYILSVGHQQWVKGFDRLLECVPAIRAACPDARFVFVGSARGERWFRRRLATLAATCKAIAPGAKLVSFVPPVSPEELNRMYSAADVVVNSSRSEGWCNAISEALAVGTPVVATNVGGNAEQVCRDELGTIVPDGDHDALASAILTALDRRWDRDVIRAHGASRSWAQVAVETHAVLARVVAQAHRTSETLEPAACWQPAGGTT